MNDKGFRDRLDVYPWDWDARLIYADWLDEHDNHDLACAQRWMALMKKHPRKVGKFLWAWHKDWAGAADRLTESTLPKDIFIYMGSSYHFRQFIRTYTDPVYAECALLIGVRLKLPDVNWDVLYYGQDRVYKAQDDVVSGEVGDGMLEVEITPERYSPSTS